MIIQSSKKRERLAWRPAAMMARWLSRQSVHGVVAVIFLSILWSFSVMVVSTNHIVSPHVRVPLEDSTRHLKDSPQQRIVMVSYIFGRNKAFVQMFAESVRHSGIDVVIIGSPPPSFELPPNIRHIGMAWNEFAHRVSYRLLDGKPLPNLVSANRNKINDFKPFFAHLFPEIVKGYDWWGHLDNDLLLGNVRRFVTDEMLSAYDVITPLVPHHDMLRTWGPFTLYRNTNTTNQLFRLASHPLDQLVNDSRLLVLDEGGRMGKRVGESLYWNSSMSGILTNHYKRLGIRVHSGGLPCAWDGECGGTSQQEHCAECTLTLKQQKLTTKSDLNCNAVEHEQCNQEVLLCHYQAGKKNLEKSLQNGNITKLIHDGRLRASYLEGFTNYEEPFVNEVSMSS